MERDDKIRIIKYGIQSSAISTILAAIYYFLNDFAFSLIGLGSLGPLLLFGKSLYSVSDGLLTLIIAICWFLIGIIIGNVTSKRNHAILLWIGCQIVGFVLMLPLLIGFA